jgi:FtsP/CotA-like multicopper oxidase with cupredoxin domain
MTRVSQHFPTDTAGLPESHPPEVLEPGDGDQIELRIAPVAKPISGATVRMLAYNGSIPGPTLRVRQGSRLAVNLINEGDLETTVHWHGLRVENRYDGTPETQRPVAVGESLTSHLQFPDPGIYWYHPHIREDYTQEMGLYGAIVVVPGETDYWPPVNRELVLILDDFLLEDGKAAPFSRTVTTYTAMGRYGNVFLVNGEPCPTLDVKLGEVVRFYLVNTANTRVFHVAIHGARLKRVGGDSGRYEREELVDSLLISPSERMVVDARFENPGPVTLVHRTPRQAYLLAVIMVGEEPANPSLAGPFEQLRTNADLAAERDRLGPYLAAEPDRTLALVAEMNLEEPELPSDRLVYTCPMHPAVSRDQPGRCPECGMKLMAAAAATEYVCPMHPEIRSSQADRCSLCGMKLLPARLVEGATGESHHHHPTEHHGPSAAPASPDATGFPGGIEWEDDMVEVNRGTTPANLRWKLIDRATGAEGAAIDWRFRVGDRVKIRLVNEMDSDHPMQHPFHIHGAGRFLVLSRDGAVEPNLVWKDTVLIPTGQTVDILLEVSNPGRWMAHCHIAEHHESGMMLSFTVEP